MLTTTNLTTTNLTTKRLTAILASLAILMLTGCSSSLIKGDPQTVGLQEPCIICGEDWIFIQNRGSNAQLSAREQGYDGTNYDTTVRY